MSVTVCIDGSPFLCVLVVFQELAEQYGSVDRALIVTGPAGGSLSFGYIEMARLKRRHA